jgi:hypothetical protein
MVALKGNNIIAPSFTKQDIDFCRPKVSTVYLDKDAADQVSTSIRFQSRSTRGRILLIAITVALGYNLNPSTIIFRFFSSYF